MQVLYCWRCKMEIPMLDEAEGAVVRELLRAGFGTLPYDGSAALAEYYRITGFRETNPAALWHHQLALYGPPCEACGKPLRTPQAKLCAACWAPRQPIGTTPDSTNGA